jgi:hypothetical protein
MASRLDLQSEFEKILGSRNVYFNPPSSIRMTYPCIRYSRSSIVDKHADDRIYNSDNRYEVTVIDPNPDSKIPDVIRMHFPMCRFDRSYVADNLSHSVLTLYY